jgi:hypothetical protein
MAKRIHRELTPEEQQRWNRANAETESEKEDILAKARRIKAARNKVGTKRGRTFPHNHLQKFKCLSPFLSLGQPHRLVGPIMAAKGSLQTPQLIASFQK